MLGRRGALELPAEKVYKRKIPQDGLLVSLLLLPGFCTD
jgi:hypothetical protein